MSVDGASSPTEFDLRNNCDSLTAVTTRGKKYQTKPNAASSSNNGPVDREVAICEPDDPPEDLPGRGRVFLCCESGAAAISLKTLPTDSNIFPAVERCSVADGGVDG